MDKFWCKSFKNFSANCSKIWVQDCLHWILVHQSLQGVQRSAWIFPSMGYGLEHPLFISFFLHTDIICYFSSLLVNSGYFQLPSTTSTTILLLKLMAIKHGCHVALCSYWHHQWGCFFLFLAWLGKIQVMPNMSGEVAWLRQEFWGASGVIWHAPNSAHQRHGILGAQGNLGARDWWN